MNIPAFANTPDGLVDNASGIEHFSPRDANYSLLALGQIKARAIEAWEAADKLHRMQTSKLPWETNARQSSEQKLGEALRTMTAIQEERVAKGYVR